MSSAGMAPGQAPKKKSNKWLIGCLVGAGLLFCVFIPVVGVLAAIAVPNFMKFKCKSLQSEAKVSLMSLRTAEEAFHAEHGYYTSDLVALEWQPFGSPRYLYGFADAGPGNVRRAEAPGDYDETRQHTAALASPTFDTSKMVDRNGSKLAPEDFPDSFVERDHFIAAAVADIKDTRDGHLDTWTIDEKGDLKNDYDACTGVGLPSTSSYDDGE